MPPKIHASLDASKPILLSPCRIRSRRSVSSMIGCCSEAMTAQKEICGLDRFRKWYRRIVVETRSLESRSYNFGDNLCVA